MQHSIGVVAIEMGVHMIMTLNSMFRVIQIIEQSSLIARDSRGHMTLICEGDSVQAPNPGSKERASFLAKIGAKELQFLRDFGRKWTFGVAKFD